METLRRHILTSRYSGTTPNEGWTRRQLVDRITATLPPMPARGARRAGAAALVAVAILGCLAFGPRPGDGRARAAAETADQTARAGDPEKARAQWSAVWREGANLRILLNSRNRLFELNAKTGKPVPSFGKEGVVSLTDGKVYEIFRPVTVANRAVYEVQESGLVPLDQLREGALFAGFWRPGFVNLTASSERSPRKRGSHRSPDSALVAGKAGVACATR